MVILGNLMDEIKSVFESTKDIVKRRNAVCLNLACGNVRHEGMIGVDIVKTPAVDIQLDLIYGLWPWQESSVDLIYCAHFFEHIAQYNRRVFLENCYRVLKPDGQLTLVFPKWNTTRALADPTHEWPPVTTEYFLYYNKKWLSENRVTHFTAKTDFSYIYFELPINEDQADIVVQLRKL